MGAAWQMRTVLYGKKAANLYTQAFVQNTQARALYQEAGFVEVAPYYHNPIAGAHYLKVDL